MDETKMIKLLDDHLKKTDIVEKINKLESKIENSLKEIRNEIESATMTNQVEITNIRNAVTEVEKSQKYIDKEYESQREKINELINDNKNFFLENQQLRSKEVNNSNINKLAQYNRSSFMVEIAGIPKKDNENALDLVAK